MRAPAKKIMKAVSAGEASAKYGKGMSKRKKAKKRCKKLGKTESKVGMYYNARTGKKVKPYYRCIKKKKYSRISSYDVK
jgi:hypothetical protein